MVAKMSLSNKYSQNIGTNMLAKKMVKKSQQFHVAFTGMYAMWMEFTRKSSQMALKLIIIKKVEKKTDSQ